MLTKRLRVLIVNNQTSEPRRVVSALGSFDHVDCKVARFDGLDGISADFDCVILTGTDLTPSENPLAYRDEMDFILNCRTPLLAICGGFQILTLCFSGEVAKTTTPQYGRVDAVKHIDNELFHGLPEQFTVFTKHRFYVSRSPDEFDVIASQCKSGFVYAAKHRQLPFYGVQFHPERGGEGTRVMRNFLTLAAG